MRNLLNTGYKRAPLPSASNLPLSATAWDTATDSVICAFGPTQEVPVIELKRVRYDVPYESRGFSIESITSWDALCPLPDLSCDEIVSLQYFPDTSTACLVLAGGDLILVREDALPGEDRIEIVGSVDSGIAAATWSPDEELLAIVTRTETFLFMTRDFENVSDVSFSPEDVNASKHVSVGWGKKETQFKGKRAKALRDPTMPETVDEGKLSPLDDGKTTVSWRGDGAFVAVNSIISEERRIIRVFTREGVLDSASEPVDGLESALSWRPSGNLLAAVQRKADNLNVVFFERNGLRHGEFPLRLSQEQKDAWRGHVKLMWNIDSSVLAVHFQDRLQLWTMGNYHYYLKQEIFLGNTLSSKSFRWHPEQALRMCVAETSWISSLDYIFDLTGGSMVQPRDYGIMAVIDGKSLKLTPLKLAGVPPPMALFDTSVEEPIIAAAISATGRSFAILTRRGLYLYAWDLTTRPCSAPQHLQFIRHHDRGGDPAFRQLLFDGNDDVLVTWISYDNQHHIQRIRHDENTVWSTLTGESALQGPLLRLVTDVQHHSAWVQYSDKLEPLERSPKERSPTQLSLSNVFLWMSVVSISHEKSTRQSNGYDLDEHSAEVLKIGLTQAGELFADSRLLAKNCTSFLVTQAHLIFTTTQHLLKFVHLARAEELEVPPDTPENDERCRTIERGAKLVTVTPSKYAVTLQMPRGNLETIYPRALVLAGIRQHIDSKDYKSAYLACRNHQVDTNILCDYQPEQFMSSISTVIGQLKKGNRIDDFLAKLRDEDVSITMYRDTLKVSQSEGLPHTLGLSQGAQPRMIPNGTTSASGKTNRICDAFLEVFNKNPSAHVQNSITAYVSKRPSDLSSALQVVSKLRETSAEEADAAMVHLCFLSDVNRLYDVALSLYDIPLTLLVAEQSQKDPREYMPFLEHLHAIPHESRRRFEIDDYLHNYTKAQSSLFDLSAHDELERYCVKHDLYREALALYKYEQPPQPRFKAISHLFAQYLVSQSRNRQAAILYESLQEYSSAYPLYALAHMWRESLTCASFVPLTPDQRKEHALSLANSLAEHDRDFRAAATIHSEHLHDAVTAARLLCKGSYFGDATRLLALRGLGEEIHKVVDTGLTEKFGEILELLADCKSQFAAQVPRIEELRIKKAEDPLAFFGGEATVEGGTPGDVPDNVSIAPTNASTTGGQSLFTRYGSSKGAGTVMSSASRKTSKTRRKEERKRAMGKKGSVYEEEYLVGSIGRCIERVTGAIDEIHRLGEGLLRRGMRERVEVLEQTVQNLLHVARDSAARVWIQEPTADVLQQGHQEAEDHRPDGADGVLWDSQQQGASRVFKEPPPIKDWKALEA